MIRLFDYLESGNGYKVRLLLNQLGKSFERVELNIVEGETRNPGY
ncbi:MAG: glutathione S-transferase family protein, partial [Gammaproteobacteria bacterium]